MSNTSAEDRMTKIRELLRDARKRSGMTQAQVAEAMGERLGDGWYQSTVGRVESGTRALNVVEALTLAKVVGIEPSVVAQVASMPESDQFVELKKLQVEYLQIARDVTEDGLSLLEANKSLLGLLFSEKIQETDISDHLKWLEQENGNLDEFLGGIADLLKVARSRITEFAYQLDPSLDVQREH